MWSEPLAGYYANGTFWTLQHKPSSQERLRKYGELVSTHNTQYNTTIKDNDDSRYDSEKEAERDRQQRREQARVRGEILATTVGDGAHVGVGEKSPIEERPNLELTHDVYDARNV